MSTENQKIERDFISEKAQSALQKTGKEVKRSGFDQGNMAQGEK
jgi:hypothetical protein